VIDLDDARALVLAACAPLAPVSLPLADVAGCVLAEPVDAAEAVPPFDNTAVDGFAVHAADTADGVELPVVATVAAGAVFPGVLGAGLAVRIMTGAPMPAGADAVVMVEDTSPRAAGTGAAGTGGDTVRLGRSVDPGASVRRAGSDLAAGARVLDAGVVLTPAHVGVLASVGRTDVLVHRRPRVGVLSTGDELVEDGSPLQPGQIRESNRTMLKPMLAVAGCEVVDLGLVRDDEAALERALLDGAERCDALVTSGGVSMGDFDVVKAVLSRIAEMHWMQIAIKPAKPFAFGLLAAPEADGGAARKVPVFGLPGNPVSSMVSFELLARPALRRMAGHADGDLLRTAVKAVADEALERRPDGKTHWMRVHGRFADDGRFHVRVTGEQGSHQLANSAAANALAEVPDGPSIPAGADVRVLLLGLH
jgi:molybdenum cofactor synthesis domain-containing protein